MKQDASTKNPSQLLEYEEQQRRESSSRDLRTKMKLTLKIAG